MVIKYFVILVISLLWPCWLHSQELPSEGAVLNYRLIPFQFSQAGNGSLEIAPGYFNNEDSFSSKIIKRIPFSGKKLIGEVPQFGGVYTWRVVYKYSGKKADHQAITGGKLHHFSTASFPLINRAKSRLRILQPGKRLKDEYVLMDGCSAMYDMDGNPVWFLPDMGGTITDATVIRDMKMTPQGTITFLRINPDETKVYEIDIDGRILWQGPDDGSVSGENSEHYHHEFTRLANGHYMIMGNEQVAYQVLSTRDSIQLYWEDKKRPGTDHLPFGTLIEYDNKGKVVWSWHSTSYFKNSDILYHTRAFYQSDIDVHDNSFFFDAKDNAIYISFRNISRIIKIAYPEGRVLCDYGERYLPGRDEIRNELYTGQHSLSKSANGMLYLFNNNTGSGSMPRIIKMKEWPGLPGYLIKVWEYECKTDTLNSAYADKYPFLSGGNVIEMPGGDVFVSMAGISKVFIVNENKKIKWSAIPEKWNEAVKKWEVIAQYRASIIIGNAALERLLFGSRIE